MQQKRARSFLRQTLNTLDLRSHIPIISTASIVQPFQIGKLSFRITVAGWKFELAYHSFYLLPFLAIQRAPFPSSDDRSDCSLSTINFRVRPCRSYENVGICWDLTRV